MFAKRGVGLVAPPPVLTTARRLRHVQIPRLRHSALNKLAAISSPVLTIDCLFLRADYGRGHDATWYARYSEYLQAHGKHIAELSPAPFVKKEFDAEPASHVLLGDLTWNSFDTILITEHANGAEAARVVRQVDNHVGVRWLGEGSLILYGERSAAFAGLPTFDGTAAGEAALSQPTARRSTDCPFIYEKMDSSGWTPARTPAHMDSWRALRDQRASADMLAFNLIRTPDPNEYKRYSSHFGPLTERYGMRFVEVAALPGLDAVLVCDEDATDAQLERRSWFENAVHA